MSKRALIIGNGPSLRGQNFEEFRSFPAFFMNAAYRFYQELGWYPAYYSCLDLVVGLSHKSAIADLFENRKQYGIKGFLLRGNLLSELGLSHNGEDIFNFDSFAEATTGMDQHPITTGSHTLAWAVYLGFRHITLHGIDLNYSEELPGQKRTGNDYELLKTDDSPNPNYFFDGYQQAGDRFNVPNPRPDMHLEAWRKVAKALEQVGGLTIENANPASAVDCFPMCHADI